MQGVEQYQTKIDYSSALQNISTKVKDIDQSVMNDQLDEDEMEQQFMNESAVQEQEGYEGEFQEVIQEMSRIITVIKSGDKSKITEDLLLELSPRIWTLANEHDKQPKPVQQKCFLETLLKGSFCLLALEFPRAILRFSACNIHLFLKIFDENIKLYENVGNRNIGYSSDFSKIFKNYLYETMKSIFLQAKEGTHDQLFKDENLIPQLGRLIHFCFLEKSDLIIQLTSQKVNDKLIMSDDLYDLMNYTLGTIKCFTQTNQDVQKECIANRYLMMLSKSLQNALNFGTNSSKQAQILVQMCGTLRNLANDEQSYQEFCTYGIIGKLITVLEKFRGHKELMLNISRILSKLSMDADCNIEIIKLNKLPFFLDIINEYQTFTSFLIRIAFVLANLTTYFDEAKEQISNYDNGIKRILEIAITYFQRDENGDSGQEGAKSKQASGNLGSIEDSLVKLIRLLANMCTDTQVQSHFVKNKDLLQTFLDHLINALKRKSLPESEEFIFNGISCATNLLFYDTPNSLIFTPELRIQIFNSVKGYMLQTQNEEIQIESVRVMSNLSRHPTLCEEFVKDKTFLEALIVVLDHTLRDLVFYTIGILINITLHESLRSKVLDQGVVPKLIDVLKDSNIEDMDLAKVSAKALHNVAQERNYWNIDNINKLDEILGSVGEELDSIMDVANEDELVEIKGLRDMINALINDMPEPMFDCPDKACGRKFKNRDELEKHCERRHGMKLQ